MPYIGRHSSLNHPDWGYTAPGRILGATFDPTSQHLWAHTFGLWGGKNTNLSSSNVTTRIAAYVTSGGNPTSRLGYSDQFTVSAAMIDSVSGASYVAAVNTIDVTAPTGATFSGIPVAAGSAVHIAALGTVGYLSLGMIQASLISANNEKFYVRTGLSQPPPNPFGTYSATNEGHPVFWIDADANVAPTKPSGLAPSGSILDLVPTMAVAFVDGNTNRGDYLNQYRIQTQRVSDSVSMWDATISSSSAEKTAAAVAAPYAGTTLVRGTQYRWRIQVSDHFGTWSEWSDWVTFTPSSLGTITLDGTPTGRITTNQPTFQGKWTHQTSTSMKRVQIRLWNGSGDTILKTGADYDIADVASAAAPGTLFSVSFANSGLSTLAWGTEYQYDMRGYDGTQWGNWSNKRSFKTNAPPTIPVPVSPQDNWVGSVRPLLEVSVTDADATDGSLTVNFELLNTSDVVQGTYAGTWHAASKRYQLQTTSTHLASFGTVRKWRAYAYDGNLYSGGATSSGAASRSAMRTVTYAAVPSVTVSAPISPVTTSSVTVAWTSTNQTHYRVVGTDDTGATAFDSGTVASASQSVVIPSGYHRNGHDYSLVVAVTDTTTLTGESAPLAYTVSYPPATTVQNLAVAPVKIGTDLWESAVRLTWDATTYGTDVWLEYTIARDGLVLKRITSPTETVFVDYVPTPGVAHAYEVTQTIMVGIDDLTSNPASGYATVVLGGVVLVSIDAPETVRTSLRYTNEREYGRTTSDAVYVSVDDALPTTVRSPMYYRTPAFDVQLFDDAAAPAATRRMELEAVDRHTGTFCYRDNHGRKLFVTVPDVTITDHVPNWYTASIQLREEKYREGES